MKTFLLRIAFFLGLLCSTEKLFALDYYWVGGSGNWSDHNAHWAKTSGGAVFHDQVPTSMDNVFFDANSGFTAGSNTVMIDNTVVYCANMDWTGATNNPIITGPIDKMVFIFGSLTMAPNMTWSVAGEVHFGALSSGKTITSAGHCFINSIFFEGNNGEWTLQDDICVPVIGEYYISHRAGKLITNDKPVTTNHFLSINAQGLDLGSSLINANDVIIYANSTHVVNAGTSCFQMGIYNLGYGFFDVRNATINKVVFKANGEVLGDNNLIHDLTFEKNGIFASSNTFDILTFTKGHGYAIRSGMTQTINTQLNSVGDCNNYISLYSATGLDPAEIIQGGNATIIKPSGTLSTDYTILRNITATGGATFLANNSVDGSGNSGWVFMPAMSRKLYWVGGNGDWSDNTHWSLTSGGVGGNCIPSPIDDVYFDANSGFTGPANSFVNLNNPFAFCRDMDWTGVQNRPSLETVIGAQVHINGSLILSPNMGVVQGFFYFDANTAGKTITLNGNCLLFGTYFNGKNGEWTFQDKFCTTTLTHTFGTLNTNNQEVTAPVFISSENAQGLKLGSSLIKSKSVYIQGSVSNNIDAGTSCFDMTIYNIVSNVALFNAHLHKVIARDNVEISGEPNASFHEVILKQNGLFRASQTFDKLTFSAGKAYTLIYNNTHNILTINDQLNIVGTCNDYITIQGGGFIKTSGTVNVKYVVLGNNTASGGASFMTDNSVDNGGNSGWMFMPAMPRKLYWVGGTGDWSDGAHWSLASGGVGGNCIPTLDDDVCFDANSGFTDPLSSAVNLNLSNSYCKNMNWTKVQNNPALIGDPTKKLSIYGSLTLSPNMRDDIGGAIYFSSTNAGNTITTNGKCLGGGNSPVVFDGVNGEWILQDNFCINGGFGLSHEQGTLRTNDKTLSVYNFYSAKDATGLYLGSSTIKVLNTAYVAGGATKVLDAGTSCFEVNYQIILENGELNKIILKENAVVACGSNNNPKYKTMIFEKDGTIVCNNTFDNLSFAPGHTYLINPDTRQTITVFGTFTAPGTGAFPIEIKSSVLGRSATIYKDGTPFCLDFLYMTDMTAAGSAYAYAGGNSNDVSGNTKFIFKPCPGCFTVLNPAPVLDPTSIANVTAGGTATLKLLGLSPTTQAIWFDFDKTTELYVDVANNFRPTLMGVTTYYAATKDLITGCISELLPVTVSGCTPQKVSIKDNAPLCVGAPDLNLEAVGGGGVAWSWTGPSFTSMLEKPTVANPTLAHSGLYSVTVTDGGGCTNTATKNIVINPTLSHAVVETNVACYGNSTGSLVVTASGGSGSYQFSKDDGSSYTALASANPYAFDNLAASSTALSIKVRDENGCESATSLHTITEPTELTLDIEELIPAACFGGNDGSIRVQGVGGTIGVGYQYSFEGGSFGEPRAFDMLAAKEYTVVVKDGNTCTTTKKITVGEAAAISFNTPSVSNVKCNGGNDGQITISATGGTGTITYSILPNIGSQSISGTFTGLTAQEYTITATDENNCTNTTKVTVEQPTVLNFNTPSVSIAKCNGSSDGQIAISASGGTGAITYSISPNIGTQTISGTFTGLTAQEYTITATDENNCSASTKVTVGQATALSFGNPTITNVKCNGGSDGQVVISATGGTGAITYSILPNIGSQSTSGTFTGLTAQEYTITAKDAKICTTTINVTVGEATALSFSIPTVTNVKCNGGNDGQIVIAASGGTGIITYAISPNIGNQSTSGTFTGLTAQEYTITAKDANNCTATTKVTVGQATALSFNTPTVSNVKCNGGSDGQIVISATGGTGVITYSISPNIGSQSTSGTFTGLMAQEYTITATDENNCTNTTKVTVEQPTVLNFNTPSVSIAKCNGSSDGQIAISASGGTGAITYSISPNIGTQTISGTFTGLTAQEYTITATDENNCTNTTNVTVQQPTVISFGNPTVTNVKCKGGSDGQIIVTASGGTGSLEFSKDNGLSYTMGTSPFSFDNLNANTYLIKVKDANSCETTATAVDITEPSSLPTLLGLTKTFVQCYGEATGSITILANGGTGGLSFSIDNGTTYSTGISPFTFYNLVAGIYPIRVKDERGCEAVISSLGKAYPILQPDQLNISINTLINVACRGGATGSVNVSTSGGTGAVTYSIFPNIGNQNTSGIFTGLTAQEYTLTAIDANSCSTTKKITVSEANNINFNTPSVSNAKCNGGNDGQVVITASGGTGAITYSISPNIGSQSTNGTFTGLTAQDYIVTATDENSCSNTIKVTVGEATALSFSNPTITNVKCAGGNDGRIVISASGGTGTKQYSISPNIGSHNTRGVFTGLTAQSYIITVTDANSCSASINGLVEQPSPLILANPVVKDISCKGSSDGQITLSASGGTGDLQFSKDNGINYTTGISPFIFSNLTNGNYRIKIKDANNCTVSTNTTVGIAIDNVPPTILCPANNTIQLGSGDCNILTTFAPPSVSDNCSATNAIIIQRVDNLPIVNNQTLLNRGIHTVKYRATDEKGNKSECSFEVNVSQLTSSPMKCLPSMTVSLDENRCLDILTPAQLLTEGIYTCFNDYSVEIENRIDFNYPANYITPVYAGETVKAIVWDLLRVNRCSTFVTVVDRTAPTLVCPLDMSISCTDLDKNTALTLEQTGRPSIIKECSSTTLNFKDRTLEKPCGETFTTRPQGFPSDKFFNLAQAQSANKILIREFTVVDSFGNDTTCKQVIYIKNDLVSHIVCPNNATVNCINGVPNTQPNSTGSPFLRSQKNINSLFCSVDMSYSDERVDDILNNRYTITRTWLIKDLCAKQTTTCKQLIFVNCLPPTPQASISGSIKRESGDDVTATVKIFNQFDSINVTTGSFYNFTALPIGQNYRIRPERTHDVYNGISTFDIALISKYILDIERPTSPYQLIAMDVNRNGEIDALDMVLIRNLILRKIKNFPNNIVWRFIPKNYVFRNPQNPFSEDFPEVLFYNNLNQPISNADFVAVKMGDANLSAQTNLTTPQVRNTPDIAYLHISDKRLEKGKEYSIPIKSNIKDLISLQFALSFDKNAVAFLNVENGDFEQFGEGNFNIMQEKGIVATAWANAKATNGETVFSIKIKSLKDVFIKDVLTLNTSFIDNLAFNTEGDAKHLQLQFLNEKLENPLFELHQNRPNPFSHQTTISFILPSSNTAELTIYDINGRQIYSLNRIFAKGYNEILLNNSVFKSSGIYFYRLKADKYAAVKRMQLFLD